MRATVRVMRFANDELHGFPFRNQRGNGGKADFIVLGMNRLQRVCDTQRKIGDGDTDAFFTEIESEHTAVCVRREG